MLRLTKSRRNLPNFVIYKQFSVVEYFALKAAAFYTQLLMQSQWHSTADFKRPPRSAFGTKRVKLLKNHMVEFHKCLTILFDKK